MTHSSIVHHPTIRESHMVAVTLPENLAAELRNNRAKYESFREYFNTNVASCATINNCGKDVIFLELPFRPTDKEMEARLIANGFNYSVTETPLPAADDNALPSSLENQIGRRNVEAYFVVSPKLQEPAI